MKGDLPTQRADQPDDLPTVRGLAPGRKVFGRYVLNEIVERGGMRDVWRAHDQEMGEVVALKFLADNVVHDEAALLELRDETRLTRQLRHPNIVGVYDFVREGELAAFSMELVDGATLSQLRLAQPGEVFSAEVLSPIVTQLCAALDYLHGQAKIVHRDLKPRNVLVTKNGMVKVTDFGIARSISESSTRLTGKAGDTSGTLPYMSPQQLLNRPPLAGDDVYSLGALLYELLTGKPPFFGGDLFNLIRSITPPSLTGRRKELGVTGPPLPQVWEETIAACLAKEINDRPSTAGAVAAHLHPVKSAMPHEIPQAAHVGAAPPSPASASAPKLGSVDFDGSRTVNLGDLAGEAIAEDLVSEAIKKALPNGWKMGKVKQDGRAHWRVEPDVETSFDLNLEGPERLLVLHDNCPSGCIRPERPCSAKIFSLSRVDSEMLARELRKIFSRCRPNCWILT